MTAIDTAAIRSALGAVSAAGTDPRAALGAVLDLACSAVRARNGTIWLPAGDLLQPLVERDGERHPASVPARRVHALACIAADTIRSMPLPQMEGATVLVPLHRDGRAMGVLELTWDDLEQPDAQALEMAEIMAGICEVASGTEGAVDSPAPAAHDLLHVIHHDALTGLPNRTLLTALLQDQVEKSGEHAALVLIDLSRFKDINDTLGHRFGDTLLQEIAARLQSIAHPGDVVARLGGDEFALLLPGCDEAEAAAIARHILAVLDMPCILDDRSIDVSAGLGIALFPDHGVDMETLLRRADVAMYAAKATGGGYAFYSPDQDRNNLARLTLTGELHQALAHDQFFLVYQPLLRIPGGDLHGMEALVRWHHPERGMIPPDQFIPLAEQTGLIGLLTLWVMEAALRQAQAWRAAGYRTMIAVNMSMRTLHDPQLNETLAWLLRRYEIPAATLLLEITESTLMADPARALGVLARLSEQGVRIAIDDFGTGYSSLGRLKHLPVHQLKVDMSFVQGMAGDARDRAIVRSVVDLAHSLGLQVVAEGIEDRETWEALSAMGCDLAQGYLISKPLRVDEMDRWLHALPARGNGTARG